MPSFNVMLKVVENRTNEARGWTDMDRPFTSFSNGFSAGRSHTQSIPSNSTSLPKNSNTVRPEPRLACVRLSVIITAQCSIRP